MIVNRITKQFLINSKIIMRFGGHHHHKVYDWRDDHNANPDFVRDPRMIGVKRGDQYEYPFKADHAETWSLSHPEQYDASNLAVNMVGCQSNLSIQQANFLEPAVSTYEADIAHEYDYQSEDVDFQPESFQTQHFRKKGPLWMWMIVGFAPLWFFGGQLFFQYWPDEDNWRYQRPPPLNYPDDAETPDTEYYEMFKSQPHRDYYDAGIVNAPFFEIKDGKKIYSKWAGVNQPREVI